MRTIVILFLAVSSCDAANYYIDYVGGSDTNNGTSKSTPLKRAPGMTGCANTCASLTLNPGDNVILKGGVTWPNAALGWENDYSGNASTSTIGCTGTGCVYIGVDQTWYTGSSWARPILNGNGSAVSPIGGGSIHDMIFRMYCGYCVVDNIEFTGLYWDSTTGSNFGDGSYFSFSGSFSNQEIKNCYFHGWSHGTLASGTEDSAFAISGNTSYPSVQPNSSAHDNVFDGSDTTEDSMAALHGGPVYLYNNFVQYMSNGFIGPWLSVNNNTIQHILQSFNPATHQQAIESTGSPMAVYNNLISDVAAGTAVFHTPVDNGIDYSYNNVIYEPYVQAISIDNSGLNAGTGSGMYIYNDTIVQYGSAAIYAPINGPSRTGSPYLPFLTVENSHLVTDGGTFIQWLKVTTQTASNNLQETNAQATSNGYTASQTWPYSPTSGSSPTVGAGLNLSASCSAIVLALCSDTTLGVGYNTSNHTVMVPGRNSVSRPSTWDIGAYQYVAPPSSVNANVGGGGVSGSGVIH